MPRRDRFHPDFATDLISASAYYDAISYRTGDRFRESVDSRLDILLESPELFAEIRGSARAARVPKFPYVVIYEIQADFVHFIALVHGATEHENWFSRLG